MLKSLAHSSGDRLASHADVHVGEERTSAWENRERSARHFSHMQERGFNYAWAKYYLQQNTCICICRSRGGLSANEREGKIPWMVSAFLWRSLLNRTTRNANMTTGESAAVNLSFSAVKKKKENASCQSSEKTAQRDQHEISTELWTSGKLFWSDLHEQMRF